MIFVQIILELLKDPIIAVLAFIVGLILCGLLIAIPVWIGSLIGKSIEIRELETQERVLDKQLKLKGQRPKQPYDDVYEDGYQTQEMMQQEQ